MNRECEKERERVRINGPRTTILQRHTFMKQFRSHTTQSHSLSLTLGARSLKLVAAYTIYNLLNLNRNNKSQIELIVFVLCRVCCVLYTSGELNYYYT